ncbi:helix-turn-helix domain-containing protein [Pelomicrobium methylotrophicum]|uniref:Helix-turn-helix transcriptional regulator n=1 Tax=Pelomicrobium methylotrophicum TaxID=2602750 RepID=A0A5C7EWP4_9PROT|nr:helix-turn-helix transcriptional regulator [Pelomicrobium methylotrophicum]TXF11646.1 helix-turn-helix transcriptional regulator [Pelomicrobium methylotrophicum]
MPASTRLDNPRLIRLRLGMSQTEFWGKIGVTQSGGSRYESGRPMPRPVRELLRLVHVEGLDLSSVNRRDIELIHYLRHSRPALYRALQKAARDKQRRSSADR